MPAQQRHVAIVGGGIMGGDIATVFASAGWTVHVMSPSQKTREALPARVTAGVERLGAPRESASRVRAYDALDAIPWKDVELAVEAATEDLPLKQRLFGELQRLARPDIPLTTNTSNFPIGEVGGALERRERVAGLHFFMPAHLVPLVEVVSAPFTSPAVAEGLVKLMKELNKAPIWVKKDVPGFVGNRLQHAMLREALYLIEDGVVNAEGIDDAVRYGFGFRFIACGPMLQKEMSGWDTNAVVGRALYPVLHAEKEYPPSIQAMVDRGHVGMKAKRGFWEWTDASIAREKARIERALQAGMEILRGDAKGSGGQGRN